jgi:alpha-ribazole phosphatase
MWTAVEKHGPCWNRIITSPLIRCAEFARALGEQLSIPVALDERIREMHFGAWEGRDAAEIMATDAGALARFWEDPAHHTPPDAEPLSSFEARVLAAWNEIIAGHAGERIMLVTHGGVIRVTLRHVLQQPLERLLEFEVEHAAMQRIHIDHRGGGGRAALFTAAPV